MTRTIIRASSLSQYPDCPRRSAARTFWREITLAGFTLRRTLRGIGACIGSAVHESAAVTLGEKAKSGSLPPISVALDAAAEALKDQLFEGEVQYEGPRGVTHNRREAEGQVIAMSSSYHRVIAPEVQPVLIETRLEAELENGIILSGQADLVAAEPGQIRDLKTGARRVGSNAPQLGAYSLLARSHGLNIESAAIDWIQRVRSDKPQPMPASHPVPIEPAETAASRILDLMARDLRVFRFGDPERRIPAGDPWAWPANPSSVLCSEKFCPAWGTTFCREGGADRNQSE